MIVNIDIETRSVIDLTKVGVHQYAEGGTTEVILICWAVEGRDEVSCWRLGEAVPPQLVELMRDPSTIWQAWNASFERIVLRHKRPPPLPEIPLNRWRCTMVAAAAYGLPLGLAPAALALGVAEQKDLMGKDLMRRMSRPRGMRNGKPIWWEDKERMDKLAAYCQQDVRTERAIAQRIQPLSAPEQTLYEFDQRINDRGITLDTELASRSLAIAETARERADQRIDEITGGAVSGVTKVKMLTDWVRQQGVDVDSLSAGAITKLRGGELPPEITQALIVRGESAKSSVAKLESMLAYASPRDHRLRGLLQFHGAATGRWAGRGPQPQNFPRGTVPDPESYIPLVMAGDIDLLELLAPPLEIISSLLRAHLVAGPGKQLVAGDFNAIEARVLAWLAGEEGLLDAFRRGKDPYKRMASSIYSVHESAVTKAQRLLGKIAILGLGYQMGAKKFVDTCGNFGMTIEPELSAKVVSVYRDANQDIVRFWTALERAAIEAVKNKSAASPNADLCFFMDGRWLKMVLPSGRCLRYAEPDVVKAETPWGGARDALRAWGHNSVTRRWEQRQLYGGLLAENIVQAVARDLLAHAMLRVEQAGFPTILTVHDEVISEIDAERDPDEAIRAFELAMTQKPLWAQSCPVAVEAWAGERYRK